MVDNTAACEIIDSRLPLKKRRINSTLNEAPLDFSLPSRERAKLELRYALYDYIFHFSSIA